MLCKKPFIRGLMSFGCGQCLPCRINRNKTWAHRMILEAHKHEHSSFITLTYSDEFLPKNNSLQPEDVSLFLKRLRKSLGQKKLRFFACGEYGSGKERPHYHLAIFGVGQHHLEDIQKAWTCPHTKVSKGFVYYGTLTLDSAQYIASYIQKGRTKPDQFQDGRHPEFSRQSRRPGIGATCVSDISDSLTSDTGAELIESQGDIPYALKHGRKSLPLGRYLRKKIKEYLGLDEEKIKKEHYQKKVHEMQRLRLEDEALARTPEELYQIRKTRYLEKKQKIRNLESKIKARTKGGML